MNRSSKGKQGTRGEKQILQENADTIAFYFNVLAASNLLYLALRYALFWESFTTKFVVLFSLTSLLSWASYHFMKYMARPVLAEDNVTVISAGSDLNMQGHVSDYLKDIMLFSPIVFFFSLLSNYFWLLLLVYPAYAFYLLWKNFLGPWFFAPAPEPDESQEAKKGKEKRKIVRVR